MDLLLSAYQKLYSALQSLERFNKGQDLFDNIACIDNFLSEFRNVTFVLQKSLARTEYMPTYERLREQYLKNPQCSWLVNKRNEVLKEKPFSLEKQLILRIYLPYKTGVFSTERFTIADEVDYGSLIDLVKRTISNIPAIEVFFSTEFIYKEIGEDGNLFATIDSGIKSLMSMLCALNKEISTEPSQARQIILDKIDELSFHKVPKEEWFVDDYVYYKDGKTFERGARLGLLLPAPTKIKYSEYCKLLYVSLTDNLIHDTFLAFVKFHMFCFEQQKTIMPTFLILYKDGTLEMTMFHAPIKTTTYRKIYEIASEIKKSSDIIAVFLVGEMIFYNDLNMLNQDYRYRVANSQSELLAFDKITKSETEQFFISSEAITKKSKDCLFPTLTKAEVHKSTSMLYPIIKAFSEQP